MRPAVLAGFVLAMFPAFGLAQNGPYLATVTDPEVRLRAGPSDQFPDTGTLPRGTQVVVQRDDGSGWLAITPPLGQVSWIAVSFIEGFNPAKATPQLVLVSLAAGGDVTLSPGRADQQEPLQDIRRAKVPSGTALTVVGPPATFAGRKWFPVMPPVEDYRYLPKTAVQFDKAMNTAFVVRENAPASAGTVPAAGTSGGLTSPGSPGGSSGGLPSPGSPGLPATPAKPAVNHQLWAQADAAEKDGRYDDAEKALFELARLMSADHDIANMCFSRIHTLREKKRGGATPAAPSTGGTLPPRDDRTTLLPPTRAPDNSGAGTSGGGTSGGGTSGGGTSGGGTSGGGTSGGLTSPGSPGAPIATAGDDRPRWSGPGMLVRSALAIDGRRTYALESSPGVPKVYVVAAQGVDLEQYVNRKIDVYGSQYTRKDLSKPYIVVTAVERNP